MTLAWSPIRQDADLRRKQSRWDPCTAWWSSKPWPCTVATLAAIAAPCMGSTMPPVRSASASTTRIPLTSVPRPAKSGWADHLITDRPVRRNGTGCKTASNVLSFLLRDPMTVPENGSFAAPTGSRDDGDRFQLHCLPVTWRGAQAATIGE